MVTQYILGPGIKVRHHSLWNIQQVRYILWDIKVHHFKLWVISTWSACWGGMTGISWSGCGSGVTSTGSRGWAQMASLGISWMQRYSLLSSTGSSSNTGLSRSAVGRGSSLSTESVSGVSRGILPKVKCQQMPSLNSRLLGYLKMKGGGLGVVKLTILKETSVVNTEYIWVGLVIQNESPQSLSLSNPSSW